MAYQPIRIFSLLMMFLLVVGCSDPLDEQIQFLQGKTQQDLVKLSDKLATGEIRNAMILSQYADTLSKERPQLATLLGRLATDGTSDGAIFKGLSERVEEAKVASNFLSKEDQAQELENLSQALSPTLFNDALSDPINVIADMSGGALARVNAISAGQTNAGEDFGPGSQLVGNPNYGNWANDGSGFSFWQWYGMYALFSNLSSPISFDRWGRHRRYSYYNDYGRYRYSSPKQRRYQENVWKKTKKSFSTGKRFSTPYSSARTGSAGLSRQSSQARTAAGKSFGTQNKFRSTGTKSSYSKNNSSFRNSRSTTSRGVSRGK